MGIQQIYKTQENQYQNEGKILANFRKYIKQDIINKEDNNNQMNNSKKITFRNLSSHQQNAIIQQKKLESPLKKVNFSQVQLSQAQKQILIKKIQAQLLEKQQQQQKQYTQLQDQQKQQQLQKRENQQDDQNVEKQSYEKDENLVKVKELLGKSSSQSTQDSSKTDDETNNAQSAQDKSNKIRIQEENDKNQEEQNSNSNLKNLYFKTEMNNKCDIQDDQQIQSTQNMESSYKEVNEQKEQQQETKKKQFDFVIKTKFYQTHEGKMYKKQNSMQFKNQKTRKSMLISNSTQQKKTNNIINRGNCNNFKIKPGPLKKHQNSCINSENSIQIANRQIKKSSLSVEMLEQIEKQKKQQQYLQEQQKYRSYFKKGLEELNLTCQSFSIYDLQNRSFLLSVDGNQRKEIASLTKIMTCYLVCHYIDKGLVKANQVVKVSCRAASVIGTSAQLQTGDQLRVIDLLYGLMLPSGNDAAIALAENIGKILYKKTEEYKRKKQDGQKGQKLNNNGIGYRCFINEMNMMAKYLGLLNTKYANPHGLNCIYNKSSAEDQARLVSIAVANCKMFCQIVDTVSYRCEVQMAGGKSRQQKWQNTNYLLGKVGCIGTKTGITPWAGACMATQFKLNGINLIIVLLKASYIDYRFTESIKLLKHVLQKKEEWDFMKKNQNCLIKYYRNQQLYDQIDQELNLLNEKIKNGQSNNQIQQEYSEKKIMVNQNQNQGQNLRQIGQDKIQQQKQNQDDQQEQKEYDSNDISFDENDDCDYEEYEEGEETQNQDQIQNEQINNKNDYDF